MQRTDCVTGGGKAVAGAGNGSGADPAREAEGDAAISIQLSRECMGARRRSFCQNGYGPQHPNPQGGRGRKRKGGFCVGVHLGASMRKPPFHLGGGFSAPHTDHIYGHRVNPVAFFPENHGPKDI